MKKMSPETEKKLGILLTIGILLLYTLLVGSILTWWFGNLVV